MVFNENKLQEEIIKTWGEFGVHSEVFKSMKQQIKDLTKQCNMHVVSVSDADIEKESQQRYGEVTGGSYHSDRPYNRKCFRKGAEWMRNKVKQH